MKTYAELKAEIEAMKKNYRQEIAAVIIQSTQPVTCNTIAAIIGNITTMEVSSFILGGHVEAAMRELGFRLIRENKYDYKTYVNIENPSDTVKVKKEVKAYSARRF